MKNVTRVIFAIIDVELQRIICSKFTFNSVLGNDLIDGHSETGTGRGIIGDTS